MKLFISASSQDSIKDIYKEKAKSLAEKLSKSHDLVFGSSNHGLMGAVYNEFLKNNKNITGICYTIYEDLLDELKLNKVIRVDTLAESTNALISEADALIFMPGAYGTLEELIESIELKRTNKHDKKIIIYNINNYFDDLLKTFDKTYEEGCVKTKYTDLLFVSSNEEKIIDYLER